VTRTGYTFAGWYDNSGLTGTVVTQITTSSTGNKEFWAKWTANTYSVHYNGNKPSTAPGSVSVTGATANSTHTYDTPSALTANGFILTGYAFDGWATSAEGAKAYDDKAGVTNLAASGTVELYAKWTPVVYDITYNQNDGTGATDATYTIESSAVDLPTTAVMSKTGYTFAGWYDNSGLTGTAVTQIATGSEGNKEFWAKWTANTYSVHYNGNKPSTAPGSVSVSGATANSTHTYDTSGALTANGFILTGYEFAGWATSVGGAKAYDDKASVSNLAASGTVGLYAKWTPVVYGITYNQNDGTGATDATYTIESSAVDLPSAAEMSRTGYVFDGWYDNEGLTGPAVTTIPAGSYEPKTFWAKWNPTLQGVTFGWNDIGGAITQSAPAITLSGTATVDVDESFDVNWWKVDGVVSPVFGTSKTIMLTAANYAAGTYQLTVSVRKDGKDYAAALTFTVE
jgi:uncharacterized repeat protein (TIGR02543 family)